MTFDQIADIVMTAPGIESGFVSQSRARDFMGTTKDKSGLPDKTLKHRTTYRVFLRTSALAKADDPLKGRVNFQSEGPDLMKCIEEAFLAVNVPMPTQL